MEEFYCRMCEVQIDGFGYCSKKCHKEAKFTQEIGSDCFQDKNDPALLRYKKQNERIMKLPIRNRLKENS